MVMLDIPHVSSIASARLSNAAANDTISATGTSPSPSLSAPIWHVAVTRPGMFPMPEARCPCEKAPCGLVIPRPEVECEVHNAYASLHQAHPGEDCRSLRSSARRARPRRLGLGLGLGLVLGLVPGLGLGSFWRS